MTNHIEVYKDTLSPEVCESLISRFDSNPGFLAPEHHPLYYQQPVRVDQEEMLNEPIAGAIKSYAQKHIFLIHVPVKWAIDVNANLQHYEPGMSYDGEHCEHGSDEDTCCRVLAWMIYLNTVSDGGGTRFWQQKTRANAVQGTMLVWPASWTHSHSGIVSPTEHKYILTGWCSYIPQWSPKTPPKKQNKGFKL